MSEDERIICNHCGIVTAHSVKTAEAIPHNEPDWSAETMHQILLCRTCSTGTYRKRVWFSEWQDADPESHASPVYEDTYFPPRLNRGVPKWLEQLPENLQEVLRESYTALQHDLRYVAAIACRTALDMAIIDKIGDIGGFKAKLAMLAEQKHITPEEAELMEAVIDSGDAAAHRGFRPEPKQILSIFGLVEKVLYILYVKTSDDQALLKQAREIKLNVPPRHKKATENH